MRLWLKRRKELDSEKLVPKKKKALPGLIYCFIAIVSFVASGKEHQDRNDDDGGSNRNYPKPDRRVDRLHANGARIDSQ